MFNDKYRHLLSSVARLPEGEGGAAETPAGETPPAAGGDPPAPSGESAEAKPNGAAPAEGDKKDAEAKPAKGRSTEVVFQDRIGELTRHRREAERKATQEAERANKAEAELRAAQELLQARGRTEGEGETKPAPAEKPAPAPSSDEDITKRIEARAAELATAKARAEEIGRRGDEIYDNAVKEFGQTKLDKAMGNFKAFDGLRVELAEAIFDVDEPHRVLFEIGSNPDTIDRLYKMADTNPVKMAVEVAKIAAKIAAKPAARKVSEAPEPPDIVNGRGNTGPVDLNDKDLPMDKWIAERNKDLQKRGVRL